MIAWCFYSQDNNIVTLFYSHSERELLRGGAETLADGLHAPAGLGAREGVPLQPVPDAQAQGGDRAHAVPLGAADQDLVPEPEDEMEEGPQAAQHQGPLRGQQQHKLPGSDRILEPPRAPAARFCGPVSDFLFPN